MLLNIANKIPLIQCLTHYPLSVHKQAVKKFLFLLILTSLPVILTALLSPIPEGDSGVLNKLLSKLKESITVSELFVYTASFLTPVLYMIYEKFNDSPNEKISSRLKNGIFKGYGLVAFLSLLMMLATIVAFGSLKNNASSFQISFLNHYLINYSFAIYLFSLYCWYLTLLDGSIGGDFVSSNRNAENKTANGFSQRIQQQGAE